ncbi:MAG: NAD-binding protein [Candidatus Marsarchaeota archaeon]|nr:NAD-binding protein [Candidatus Marsarchaeota archaeon]MCL5101790.1 NAD-binding protein [Candidatus Marsarchaeota archaeon]
MEELSGHTIVCGYGVVGQRIVETLVEHGIKFIIVEFNHDVAQKSRERGYNVVEGDATSSRVLKAAGIASAKAIAIAMDNDAKNLFTVLTARDLNKDIFISTRANDRLVREKMLEAGADHIVMPQMSASEEIIAEITKQ